MVYSSSDRKRVYLACRPIFSHTNAQLRKKKKIREFVERHRVSLDPIIRAFSSQGVVQILKSLLDDGILKSELKAKVEFPELFLISPERDIQRAKSENCAAQRAADALDEIAFIDKFDQDQEDDGKHCQRLLEPREVLPAIPLIRSKNDSAPSLYPSDVPYMTQHSVLTTTQRILEECCFDFVKRWLSSILLDNGWDCAAAVELTKWTRILAERSETLPKHALAVSEAPINDILFSTHKIRHSAVHRLPVTARGLNQLIESALRLAEALQDHPRAAQLEALYFEIDSKIKAMELNKSALEEEYASELQKLCQQREELDEKERSLRANMLSGDMENKRLIGSLLEESVREIFHEGVEWHSAVKDTEDDSEEQTDVEHGESLP